MKAHCNTTHWGHDWHTDVLTVPTILGVLTGAWVGILHHPVIGVMSGFIVTAALARLSIWFKIGR